MLSRFMDNHLPENLEIIGYYYIWISEYGHCYIFEFYCLNWTGIYFILRIPRAFKLKLSLKSW